MRIAHIANFYGPSSGGLRTAMHALGREYIARGHEYLMVVPGPTDVEEYTEYGHRVTLQSPALPFSGGYRVIVRGRDVRAVLDEFGPDVVEVSDRTTLRGVGRWAAARGIPSTFFAHERADGVLAANVPTPLRRLVPVRRLADAHNRGTVRRFTDVVCTTAYAAEEFARIDAPALRVPLGVDLERFHPRHGSTAVRRELAADDEALVLMASRLSPEKRVDLAIDAVRLLNAMGHRVRLVCAGAGVSERRARERARHQRVSFLGFVSNRERFAAMLASADVVVAPGPIETFGLAALEALASGTPVVVNRASALPEVVGNAGIAAGGTPEEFAAALLEALDGDRAVARARARARAEELPWSRTAQTLLALHGAELEAVRA